MIRASGPGKQYLLACDMYGTVIPLDDQPRRAAEIETFRRLLASRPDIGLAYVTGRHLELALEGVYGFHLPAPDLLVCDVGTTVYAKQDGSWRLDPEYRQRLARSWRGLTRFDLAATVAGISGLEAQEESRQQEFKQSYYVGADEDLDRLASEVAERIRLADISASIVTSRDPLSGLGLLDVLPVAAAKDQAVRFLQAKLGLADEQIVYAGDSGNDLAVFISGIKSIVVANTPEAVKDQVRRRFEPSLLAERVYFARRQYVVGVLEGAAHFGLLPANAAADE